MITTAFGKGLRSEWVSDEDHRLMRGMRKQLAFTLRNYRLTVANIRWGLRHDKPEFLAYHQGWDACYAAQIAVHADAYGAIAYRIYQYLPGGHPDEQPVYRTSQHYEQLAEKYRHIAGVLTFGDQYDPDAPANEGE